MWGTMERESVFRSLPRFLLLLLTSLLLIFFENFHWTRPVRAVVEQGTRPVKLSLYRGKQKFWATFSFLSFWRSGQQKIKYLEERNRELQVEAQKTKALEEENRTLRAQLKVVLPSNWELLPAQTLGKTRYLTIDKGEKEGVKIGQVVILKNILVGKVVAVSLQESQVRLPADPESKIPVRTAKTGAEGLLVGQFGRGMVLEKVTQGESLEGEDLVVTTGESGYPKDLIIGKVSWVEKKESEVFQKAGVEPSLNFDEIEVIFLVKT